MRKSVIRIACFMIVFGLVLICVNKVFRYKNGDGIYGMETFYELEDNTVDVLILGSSHAFENFNTGVLWNDYGMAAYILAGSVQPMWNTYYYLKEALKTQSPQLIVLEGYGVTRSGEFEDDIRIIRNTYGMKWSLDKLNAIKVSSPRDQWGDFILGYTQYHTRYTELSKADFYENQGNPLYEDWKGFGCNMATMPLRSRDVSGIEDRNPLYEKSEEYYRKTIELAQEHNIPIVVVVAPYANVNDRLETLFNTASDIASEYNVGFINCNRRIEEIGLDYLTDAADGSHLNYKGNQKFTYYIGSLLKDNFDISDRRGEAKYASWQRSADYTSQMIYNQELLELEDLEDISAKILNNHYKLIISTDGDTTAKDKMLQAFYASVDIVNDGANNIWFRDNSSGIDWCSQNRNEEKYIRTSMHDFCMKKYMDTEGNYRNQIIIDNVEYKSVENGINIVVYDTVTDSIVDCFGIDFYDGYRVVRQDEALSDAEH